MVFPNDAVYAKASYDHCYTKLLGAVVCTTQLYPYSPAFLIPHPELSVPEGLGEKLQRVPVHITNPCPGSAAKQRLEVFALLGS